MNVVLGMCTVLLINKTKVCGCVRKAIWCLECMVSPTTALPWAQRCRRSSSGKKGVGLAEAD